jgi:hypothetical protein
MISKREKRKKFKCKKRYGFGCVDLVNAWGIRCGFPSHDVWLIFIGVRHHHEKIRKENKVMGKDKLGCPCADLFCLCRSFASSM